VTSPDLPSRDLAGLCADLRAEVAQLAPAAERHRLLVQALDAVAALVSAGTPAVGGLPQPYNGHASSSPISQAGAHNGSLPYPVAPEAPTAPPPPAADRSHPPVGAATPSAASAPDEPPLAPPPPPTASEQAADDAQLSRKEEVCRFVVANPGRTPNEIAKALNNPHSASIYRSLKQLLAEGRAQKSDMRWYPT
jgi:hypothetical protein